MNHHRLFLAIGFVAVVTLAMAGALAACGDEQNGEATSSPTAEMTAAELWSDILGHEPAGVAADVLAKGSLLVANDANYPPASYLNDEGVMVGFDVDVAQAVADILKVELEQTQPAWDSIPTGIQAGRFDVSAQGMTPTPERQQTLGFTKPYYYAVAVVVTRAEDPTLDTAEDLAGKTIGTCGATIWYDYLVELGNVDVKSYASDVDAFPDLENGRIDGVYTTAVQGQAAIAEGKPFALSEPYSYDEECWTIKLGEDDLVAVCDYALDQLRADGTLKALSEKWYWGLDLTTME